MGEPKTMNVHEFIRGGYRTAEEPTIVITSAGIQGVWFPGTTGMSVSFNATTGHPERLDLNNGHVAPAIGLSKTDQAKGRSRR